MNTKSSKAIAAPLIRSAIQSDLWLLAPRAMHALQLRMARIDSETVSAAVSVSPKPYTKTPDGFAIVNLIGVVTKYPSSNPSVDAVIGLCPALAIENAIAAALADASVTAIVLRIDSPGGVANGSIELADFVAASKSTKPIFAAVMGDCMSAAYYIASQCNAITANSAANVGGIGVYSVLTDVSAMMAEIGIVQTVVSTGRYKGLGADGSVSGDLIQDTQRLCNDVDALFVSAVASGRKLSEAAVRTLADGRSWLAEEAKSFGLLDEVLAISAAVGVFTDAMRTSKGDKITIGSVRSVRLAMPSSRMPSRRSLPLPASRAAAQQQVVKRKMTAQERAENLWNLMDEEERSHWISKAAFIRIEAREEAEVREVAEADARWRDRVQKSR